jgi:3-deoxy-D-manno-octulosonic-acid transferase
MLTALYWLSINLYAAVLRIAAFFNPKAKLFVQGRKGLLQRMHYALINERRPRIWMHCASLGEFEQGRPILERLRAKYPQYAFVLTFFSPSGYEVRKDYDGADYVFYFPLDSPRNAKKFLSVIQPRLCLFIKYEFWYFLLSAIAKRDIPNVLVSAIFRKDQPFFKWYGTLHRRMLHSFTHIFVQDEASMYLLAKTGVQHASVSGDTRFDRVQQAMQQLQQLPVVEAFSQHSNVLVAGSTWPEDERFLQEVYTQQPVANFKLIIAPHEVADSRIADIERLFPGQTTRWTSGVDIDKKVLIIDTVGILFSVYAHAHSVWIGGGFGKEGVHNVLEAAIHGVPVSFGPVYHQYIEAKELIASGGGFEFSDPVKLALQLKAWQTDDYSYTQASEKAHDYVITHTGATAKVIAYLEAKKWLMVS